MKLKNINLSKKFVGFTGPQNTRNLVKTDQKRLQQILLNLYSNALKFTDRCGHININIEKVRNSETNQEMLLIWVKDSGMGIKKKNQNKLFKLFSSLRDLKKNINTEGIGLGLVISKLIVSKFNGNIDFFSKYRKGSTFFFSFELQPLIDKEVKLYFKCQNL